MVHSKGTLLTLALKHTTVYSKVKLIANADQCSKGDSDATAILPATHNSVVVTAVVARPIPASL